MKTTELRKKLLDSGCTLVRHGGNHDIWYSPITQRRFPIPRHTAKEVASGTLKDIARNQVLHCNTKNMKTEKVIIEVSTDGLYSAYMPSDDYGFGLAGYGETEKEAIDDFYAAVSEMKELEEADGRTFPDLQFQFEYAVGYVVPESASYFVAEDSEGYNEDKSEARQ